MDVNDFSSLGKKIQNLNMIKKVLIVTPRSPFQQRGADESDRFKGIKWFIDKGFETRVITMVMNSDLEPIEKAKDQLGIKIVPVFYRLEGRKPINILKRIFNPLFWDGAAFEYTHPEIKTTLKKEMNEFKPDVVWFDYTYLWPLYRIVKKYKTPIISRSINFEPTHFLDEDGRTLINYVRNIPKLLSEMLTVWMSDYLFSITPKEEKIYKTLGRRKVDNLPLRALPQRLSLKPQSSPDIIRAGFMPSTYTVHHNFEALRFLVEDVYPKLSAEIKEKLTIEVTGNKFPKSLEGRLPKQIVYRGYVPSSKDFWHSVDIAISPSLFGAGMQMKIFEPISLGVPTITSKRGIADYPFNCGEHLICAETADEVASALTQLSNKKSLRDEIGLRANKVARQIFSQEVIDQKIYKALELVSKK